MPSPRDKHKERTTRDSKKQNMSERTKDKQKKNFGYEGRKTVETNIQPKR